MKVSENYQGEKFHVLLITAVQKFLKEHMDAAMKSKEVDYETYGSPKQVKLKFIVQLAGRIGTVLGDLDRTFIFLAKDRKLINEHYPDLETQEEYYDYHLENFYIRLATLLDVIGKLGNEVYDLGLKKDKVSAYVFKDKSKSEGFDKISRITEDLIEKIDEYRKARHSKLHTGESEFKIFRKIVIWEDLMKMIKSEVDPILSEHTDEEIKKQLDELKEFTLEVIQLIENFMNEASLKLEEYINQEDK
tara:strand:- start:538 stop:1278 length:741 start_codon:yes stop_codon:yes gene_type:complete